MCIDVSVSQTIYNTHINITVSVFPPVNVLVKVVKERRGGRSGSVRNNVYKKL